MAPGLILSISPALVLALFGAAGRATALAMAIVLGYLFLPEQVELNLPGLPPLDKDTVPAIAAFIAALFITLKPGSSALAGWIPKGWVPRVLMTMLFVGILGTVVTNPDPVLEAANPRPALRPWDGVSMMILTLSMLLPFVLGRKFMAHPEDALRLLVVLAIAGFGYSFLALYEIRMSPQLNRMIYGFFPHSWAQHIRGDGFRPLVFLDHGLWLAIFFCMSGLAAIGLSWVGTPGRRVAFTFAGLWILMVLALSNSLGALLIMLISLPVLYLIRTRGALIFAAIFAGIVLSYPMLRGADAVPVAQLTQIAEDIDPARARSFAFRLENEDLLLEKARQRPIFGWGGWSRSHIFDERGRDVAVTDGYWIILFGEGGWVRYLGEFGLLCLPVLFSAARARRYKLGPETAAVSLILTANLVDMIPNATITPVTWLAAGALWGRLELGAHATSTPQDDDPAPPPPNSRAAYTRFASPSASAAPAAAPNTTGNRHAHRHRRRHNRA